MGNKNKKVHVVPHYKPKRNVGTGPQRWRNAAANGPRYNRSHSHNNRQYKPYNHKRRGHNSSQNSRPSVEFVADVTLPDRSHYPASKLLTKTWAMRNSGNANWGDNVELVYFKGDRSLSLEDRYPVINAAPGQAVEISASIRTPEEPGRYCTYFRLQKNGQFFGPRVWVDLIVRSNGFGAKAMDGRKNCATNNEGGNGKLLIDDFNLHTKIMAQSASILHAIYFMRFYPLLIIFFIFINKKANLCVCIMCCK